MADARLIPQLPQNATVADGDWFVYNSLLASPGGTASKLAASDLANYIGTKIGFQATTGDVTINSSYIATLATVNSNVGSFGGGAAIPVITADAKGRLTAISTVAVTAPAGTLTGATLAANVLASSLTSVGALTGGSATTGFSIALNLATLTGSLPIANLAGGTGASSSTYLRGDNTWATIAAGGNVSNSGTPTVNQFGVWVTATTIAGVSITGLVKGNGASAPGAATAGTDYVAPGTATTFTATQTLNGSTTALAEVLVNAAETTTVSATAATGTINFDVTTQSVLYYTTSASANWTLNFRGNGSNTLNSLMAIGQTMTAVFMVTQGASAFFENALTIDGGAITPKWQGGTAPAAGNASGIDVYTYSIIKTGSAAFTVLASQTQFK